MDRNEAIKLIDDRMCFGRGKWSKHHMPEIDDYWKAGQMAIKALGGKDIDVPTKWIPVSERLPKEKGYFLVTDEAAGIAEVLIDEYMYCDDGTWVWLYSQNAIAWMPLPEPWKGEEHE